LSIDKLSNKYEVQPMSLNNYAGLKELADSIKKKFLEIAADIK